jgi:hypothetical protein
MYPAGQLKLIGSFFYVSRQHVNITARYKCTVTSVLSVWLRSQVAVFLRRLGEQVHQPTALASRRRLGDA